MAYKYIRFTKYLLSGMILQVDTSDFQHHTLEKNLKLKMKRP